MHDRNDKSSNRYEVPRRHLERALWSLGSALLLIAAITWAHGEFMQSRALQQFEEARSIAGPNPTVVDGTNDASATSLLRSPGDPLGVLRIPDIDLEVPVLEGVDEPTLNRGVGRIPVTAHPGSGGNLGIAGHRDRHFRGLKNIEVGDVIEFETVSGIEEYAVRWIRVVDPDQVDVLDPTPGPAVTLVTCYPFHYVGSAPMRYIVRATRVELPIDRAGAIAGRTQVQLASNGRTRR